MNPHFYTKKRLFSITTLVVTLAVCLNSPAFAQDEPASQPAGDDLPKAKKILEWAIDAIGGKANVSKIKSGMIKGHADIPQMGEMKLEMYWSKPDKVFIKQSLEGMGESTQAMNGKIAWMHNPMMGGFNLMEDEQAEEMMNQATMSFNVMAIDEKFKTIDTIGIEDFNEEECFKLLAIDKKDREQFFFFSKKTKLLVGNESEQEGPMGSMKVQVRFEDYKKMDAIQTFTRVVIDQMGMEMEINFDEFEFNKVDDAVFAVPEEVKSMAAAKTKTSDADDDDDGDADDDDDGDDDDDDDDN